MYSLLWLLSKGIIELGVPVETTRVGFGSVLALYVVRIGRWALWPPVPLATSDRLRWLVVAVLLDVLLVGVLSTVGISDEELTLFVQIGYPLLLVTTEIRAVLAESRQLHAARHFLFSWLLLLVVSDVLFPVVFSVELGVIHEQTTSFYETVAQVDVALLLATVFQADRPAGQMTADELAGMVLLTVPLLALSLGCALLALGRGADSFILCQAAVLGLAAGVMLVGTVAAKRVAPKRS
jgi:hypothetical protein